MTTDTFTPDDTFTVALYHAIMSYGAGHKPRAARRTTEQRGQRLPGVYATPRGLYARFSRLIDGKLTDFYVATGAVGGLLQGGGGALASAMAGGRCGVGSGAWRMKTMPLIRQRDDGTWERLVIGTMKAGPAYEPYEWDMAAWESNQRRAGLARLLVVSRAVREAANTNGV